MFAQLEWGGNADADTSPQAFLDILRGIHAEMFHAIYDGEAGRFRNANDPIVTVGGPSPLHTFEAARHEDIEPLLHQLREQLGSLASAPPTPNEFAKWASILTERLFVVHPFCDGNGRVARFVVEMAADATPDLYIDRDLFGEDPLGAAANADRRQYVYALQYAHKHTGSSPASELAERRSYPYTLLERWWLRRVKPGRRELLIESLDGLDLAASEIVPMANALARRNLENE